LIEAGSRRGRMIILSAPSGAGKTSLARAIVQSRPSTVISISHTTRDRRAGEVNGQDYFFIDDSTFQDMIARNEFLEYAEVFGRYYGTSRLQAENRQDDGMDVILDIDWQGARKVRHLIPDALSIFILPPSLEILRVRLLQRGRDSDDVIEARMKKAISEMSHYSEYDCVIVNREFSESLKELERLLDGASPSIKTTEIDIEKLVFIEKTVRL